MKLSIAFGFLFALSGIPAPGQEPVPLQSESALLGVLRSDASLERKSEACRQLGQVGTRTAVPVLAGLLADEKLAYWARYALEQIPGTASTDALRAAIPGLKGRLLAGAIMSLGARPDRSSAKTLDADTALIARYLKSSDSEVATAAAYALARLGTAKSAGAIEKALASAPAVLKPVLWDTCLRSAATLSARGLDKEATGIYDRLRASDAPEYVRVGAARGAVLARKKNGIAQLIELLHSDKDALFEVALELARTVPGTEATQSLAAQLSKLPAARQALLLQSLADRGDKAALSAIREAVRRPEPEVRLAAINAIGAMGDVESLGVIVDAAAGRDEAVASAASAVIVRLPGASTDEALIRTLNGRDEARAVVAARSLARRQSRVAGSALLKAAGDGSPAVRIAALAALDGIATEADTPALIALVLKSDGSQLELVEQILAGIGSKASNAESFSRNVIDAIGTAPVRQKAVLLRTLGAVGGNPALQAVRAAAKDTNDEVHQAAVRVLCNWPTVDAAPDLLAVAKEGRASADRILALRGYLRLAGDESVHADKRVGMCSDALPLIARNEEKLILLGVLGSVASTKALALASPFIDDSAVSEEACRAVASIAMKLLGGSGAANAEIKALLTQALEKAQARARNGELRNEIAALLSKLKLN